MKKELVPGDSQGLMAARAERFSVCRCGRKIEYRWTDPERVPEITEGSRGQFKALIRCDGCGTINIRSSNEVLRYARTIGAFDAPEIVLGLMVTRRVLLERLQESVAPPEGPPNPDKAPPRVISDQDLARLATAVTRVSDLEAIMGGAKVERREIVTFQAGKADPALDEMLDKVAEEIARKLCIVRRVDVEVLPDAGDRPATA